jgi:hypothetical protein
MADALTLGATYSGAQGRARRLPLGSTREHALALLLVALFLPHF